MHNSTSVWGAEHPNAGRNIQQIRMGVYGIIGGLDVLKGNRPRKNSGKTDENWEKLEIL